MSVLRLGVIGGAADAARTRLVELGALSGSSPSGTWCDPGVALMESGDQRELPCHLVVHAPLRGDEPTDPESDLSCADVTAIDELWFTRVVPFEANLRAQRRAPRLLVPILVGPDPKWGTDAARLTRRLRLAVGPLALRIDHIGSTSVAELKAKNLIDIQIVVPTLAAAEHAANSARSAGFVAVGEWTGEDAAGVEYPEHVVVDADPGRPTNVNFRPVGAPVWRASLLFRDWLRANPDERDEYERVKLGLAAADDAHVDSYSHDKMPWIRAGLARAEQWARDQDRRP